MSQIPKSPNASPARDRDAAAMRFLCRPAVFREPERIVDPPSWVDYTPFAFWIVDALRPSTFVELGCHSGNSYASFAQAVQMLGLSTSCYGVDTWRGDPHAGFFEETIFEEWSAYHARRFSTFSTLIRATFDDAIERFPDGSIDLLHLDGYHTLEAVTHDFEAWRPKLSTRAVVLCHDIGVKERDFGAWRLWERLEDEYPSFDFRHGHGLGVLGIGKDLPDALRWLFDLRARQPEHARIARLFFARLGAAVLGRYHAMRAERLASGQAGPHDAALARARETAAVRTAEAERLAADVRSRETEVARLEAELDASGRARQAADTMVHRLDGEAATLFERLQRDTRLLDEERARRKGAESLLSWTRAQVSALSASEITGPSRMPNLQAIEASLLFSPSFYASQVPECDARGERPLLLHYVTRGWRAGLAPHPLFDPAFYVAQSPDVARWGGDPLLHYLEYGAAERRSPHPLFDVDYYLRENPGARTDGLTPLTHYLLKGAREGKNPSPFFDGVYYQERYPDVTECAMNPLEHFVLHGWREGRNPSATFGVEEYLARYPDVRESGENPLVHYVRHGRAQGRHAMPGSHARAGRPRRTDTTRIALSACPLVPRRDERPTILLVSHVGPWRPRAGNECRVDRMLRWYRGRGYRIIPLIAPLPGEELPREGVEAIANSFGNAIQVHRDGRLEYVFTDLPDVLVSLEGTFTSAFGDLLDEAAASPQERELLGLERTFCHDAVIATVLHLQRSLGPHILQVEYIWMSRLLPLVRGDVLKVIDTHDVFSSIARKVEMFGVRDVAIEPHQEAERLRRADLAIAIQDDERDELAHLVPSLRLVTAGVDFEIAASNAAPTAGQLLFVASNNARNRKGLEDFLRLAWPRIRQQTPRAELVVVGSVAKALEGRDTPGVTALGPVDDLTVHYQQAALVINPVVAGTGLKIKMLEALCHLRPVVTWPAGLDGVDPALASCCLIARDWYEFANHVIHALARSPGERARPMDPAVIRERVAPARVYGALDAAFREFFASHRAAPPPPAMAPPVSASRARGHAGR